MPSKYDHLRKFVPEEPRELTAKEQEILSLIEERSEKTLDGLTEEYNTLDGEIAAANAEQAKRANKRDALSRLIRKRIDDQGMDGARMRGFLWTEGITPYPNVKSANVDEVVEYMMANGMEDQLKLTASELAGRVEKFVKEEAENNELLVDDDGTVRSQIPGVTVYLDKKLSRTKSK